MSFIFAENINPYLVEAPNIPIKRRATPLCNVYCMHFGNMANDNGKLILDKKEKNLIIKENRMAEKWIRPFLGAEEFLNGNKRWCLWLVNANPSELRKCKLIMERIEKVRGFRLNSKRIGTQKLASTPTLFAEIRQPTSDYLLIPAVSSERRSYIPMGFINKDYVPVAYFIYRKCKFIPLWRIDVKCTYGMDASCSRAVGNEI